MSEPNPGGVVRVLRKADSAAPAPATPSHGDLPHPAQPPPRPMPAHTPPSRTALPQGGQIPDLEHVYAYLRDNAFRAVIRNQIEETGKVAESDLDRQTARTIERACHYLAMAGKPVMGAAQAGVAIAAANNPEAYGLCIQKLAALRLVVDSASGNAWVTAKWNSERGEYKLAPMEGVRGLERLLGEETHILSVDYGVVREGDEVKWTRGSSPELIILPATVPQDQVNRPESRKITHGFATLRVKDRDPVSFLFQPTTKQLEYKGVMSPEQYIGYYAYRNVLRKGIRLFTSASIDPDDATQEMMPESAKAPKP